MAAAPPYIQLHIFLEDSKPPIWRLVAVPASMTLDKLNTVIQLAFDWDSSHLHRFEAHGERYVKKKKSESFGLFADDSDDKPEHRAKLRDVLKGPGKKMYYVYDFGDNWTHVITHKGLAKPEQAKNMVTLLGGGMASPPEDCGGIWGYYDLLEKLKNPQHPDYEDAREWVPDDFDPEVFDQEAAAKQLRAAFQS